jgi:superfamily II DNA or RNA helicase
MTARPYQVSVYNRTCAELRAGHRRVLIVMATGSGKTGVAAGFIASAMNQNKRSLFVVHRVELLQQTLEQLREAGVEKVGVVAEGYEPA